MITQMNKKYSNPVRSFLKLKLNEEEVSSHNVRLLNDINNFYQISDAFLPKIHEEKLIFKKILIFSVLVIAAHA